MGTSAPARCHVVFLVWRDTSHPDGGGSEVYVEHMARWLVQQGHEVTIECAAHPNAPADEVREGVVFRRRGGWLSVYLRGLQYLASRAGRKADVVIDVHNGLPFLDQSISSIVNQTFTNFEFLILEGAQAGLSWSTILNKRQAYIQAFDNFEPTKVADYNDTKVQALLANSGIVRNRLKIQAAIQNARSFLEVRDQYGRFDTYIWQFVDGKPVQNSWKILQEIPATTKESDAMSKELKKLGFTFVGSTICYAFMQAVGMVNDHMVDCFRWQEVKAFA